MRDSTMIKRILEMNGNEASFGLESIEIEENM